ncbi:hypothetical protein [Massilia psychrophila]|jgi:hypothetical protein|uniref:Uncharacterized protein n=1 Tax=Massilia psychrophila TaxID=1603353 RepID=A0A2G8T4K8_9BURK|nr:hypothetical protein [Massilia psychrophila]PIL40987.1 hypothetical protein CR103_04425 [Massilia psychrophila]
MKKAPGGSFFLGCDDEFAAVIRREKAEAAKLDFLPSPALKMYLEGQGQCVADYSPASHESARAFLELIATL